MSTRRNTQQPWVGQHRPTNFSQILGLDLYLRTLQHLALKGGMPNLFFYGPPGTGKTTVAQVLAQWLSGGVTCQINASSERTVAVVRKRINRFVREGDLDRLMGMDAFLDDDNDNDNDNDSEDGSEESTMGNASVGKQGCDVNMDGRPVGHVQNTRRVVILDEADALVKETQGALLRLMEEKQGRVIFIMLFNSWHSFDPALVSRGIAFHFPRLTMKYLLTLGHQVCKREGLTLKPESDILKELIRHGHCDPRQLLHQLQVLHQVQVLPKLPHLPGQAQRVATSTPSTLVPLSMKDVTRALPIRPWSAWMDLLHKMWTCSSIDSAMVLVEDLELEHTFTFLEEVGDISFLVRAGWLPYIAALQRHNFRDVRGGHVSRRLHTLVKATTLLCCMSSNSHLRHEALTCEGGDEAGAKDEEMKHVEAKEEAKESMTVLSEPRAIASVAWTEVYRPQHMKDVLGLSPSQARELTSFCDPNVTLPGLLFHGPPGCGKSTAAAILCDYHFPLEEQRQALLLQLNVSQERGIDVVRKVIQPFAARPAGSRRRLVILEEADALGPDAQMALRRVLEDCEDTCSFLIILNQRTRLMHALQSRLFHVSFSALQDKDVRTLLHTVAAQHGVRCHEDVLDHIARTCSGDARLALQQLQALVWSCSGHMPSQIGMPHLHRFLRSTQGEEDLVRTLHDLLLSPTPSSSRLWLWLRQRWSDLAPDQWLHICLDVWLTHLRCQDFRSSSMLATSLRLYSNVWKALLSGSEGGSLRNGVLTCFWCMMNSHPQQ